MELSIFDCVSPLDYRYYGDDPNMIELLAPYVTERAYIASELEVEAAPREPGCLLAGRGG